MKTTTGLLLVLASATGAAIGAALTRKQSRTSQVLAVGAGFMVPWGLQALFSPGPAVEGTTCTVLWLSDTHGSAQANAPLVQKMLMETGVDRVLHSGDVVDRATDWPIWWDRPFREVVARWPVDVASGNHDHEDEATYAGFVERFGEEPKSVVCGPVEFFLMPWGVDEAYGRWLHARITASTAKWKVLVVHSPLWGVDGTGKMMRDLYAASLPYLDLVLSGHQHVSWDTTNTVNGRQIRQIIDVSGPKKYPCPTGVHGCVQDETAYWRIEFGPSAIKAERRVVG